MVPPRNCTTDDSRLRLGAGLTTTSPSNSMTPELTWTILSLARCARRSNNAEARTPRQCGPRSPCRPACAASSAATSLGAAVDERRKLPPPAPAAARACRISANRGSPSAACCCAPPARAARWRPVRGAFRRLSPAARRPRPDRRWKGPRPPWPRQTHPRRPADCNKAT